MANGEQADSGPVVATQWHVFRAGDFDPVMIRTGADLLALEKLDKKLGAGRRSLVPLLDTNGWAINIRARINIPFGTSLTALARRPPGSERPISNPYAEKGQWLYLLIAIILLGGVGYWLLRQILPTSSVPSWLLEPTE